RALRGAAELGDRQRREHDRLEQRDRRSAAADLLEDRRHLEETEARAAVLFGHRDAEQPRIGGGAPELAVEAQAPTLLDRALLFVAALVGEDLRREVADRLLIFGEREVHGVLAGYTRGTRGRPRPNKPIRSRWISLVPPPKV